MSIEPESYLPIFALDFYRNHLKIGIVHLGINLLLTLADIHLEGFGVQQGLHFRERLILLPYFFAFHAQTIAPVT